MAQRAQQIVSHLNYPQGLLAGQTAIITGSGQGIGAEAARLFANEGCKVVVCDVDSKKADAVAKSINDASPNRAIAVAGDVTDKTYLEALVKKAAEFGGGEIHYIVNNAGYTWDGVIHKITDKQWDTIIAVHNTAPFQLVRAAAPYFRVKDGKPRCIINISSTSGTHGNAGQANYSLAKAGVTGLTKTIAKEWGPQFGVRANTIAFGHIDTRLTRAKEAGAFITTPDGQRVALGIPSAQLQARKGDTAEPVQQYKDIPLGRPGTAIEAASSILAVCSPLFAYVNGQTIEVKLAQRDYGRAREHLIHVEEYERQLEALLSALLQEQDGAQAEAVPSPHTQAPFDPADLITLLSNAQSDSRGSINLLSRLVLVHRRRDVAAFLVDQLLDHVAARNSDAVHSPPSTLSWLNSLNEQDLSEPLEFQSPPGKNIRLSNSLEHEYENPRTSEDSSGLAEVWQFLGYLIVEVANAHSQDTTSIMAVVYQTLAKLHHRGLVPVNIYDWANSSFSSSVQRSPTLHLLSSRILSTLSDASWRSYQDEAITRGEQLGISYQKTQDPPGGRFRLKVRELGPEAWLEFVLWCCVESNCPQAGANLVSLLAEQHSHPWCASSWQAKSDQDRDIKIDWDRAKSRTGGAVGRIEGYSHDNPLAEIPPHTISAEVIRALIEGSIDEVGAHQVSAAPSSSTLAGTLQSLLTFLHPHHLPKDYTDYISARSFDSLAPALFARPKTVEDLTDTLSNIRALSIADNRMSSVPVRMDYHSIVQQSQLYAGLLHAYMHACGCHAEVRKAIDAYDKVQEMVDQSKVKAITSFLSLPPDQQDPSVRNQDFIMSHGQLPLFRIAAFLDVLNDSNHTSLSEWLIYSTDVDGPFIPTSAFERESVASALIRYAGANHDQQLLRYVMTAVHGRRLKPPVSVLRLEANAHIQFCDFQSAATSLQSLKPAVAGGFHPDNLACLATCILRLEARCHTKDHRRAKGHLAEAVALMRDILHGRYNGNPGDFDIVQRQLFKQQIGHILRMCANLPSPELNLIASSFREKLPNSNAPTLLKRTFNIFLHGIVEVMGAAEGVRLWDQFCQRPSMGKYEVADHVSYFGRDSLAMDLNGDQNSSLYTPHATMSEDETFNSPDPFHSALDESNPMAESRAFTNADPAIILENTGFQDFIPEPSPAWSKTEFIDENLAYRQAQQHNPVVMPSIRSLMVIVNRAMHEARAEDASQAQRASSLLRSSWIKDHFRAFGLGDEYQDLLGTIGEQVPERKTKCCKISIVLPVFLDLICSSAMAFHMAGFLSRLLRPFSTSVVRPLVPDSLAAADLPANTQRAIVAGGCFWGTEELYRKHWKDKGLIDCRVGYTGGDKDEPTYPEVCTGRTGHAESLLIAYDPDKVSYRQLIEFFFKMHDPTTLNRQGADTGTQYRSAVFAETDEQEKIANEVKDKVAKEWYKDKPVTTEIKRATKWWDAEPLHQDYIHVQLSQGNSPYQCPAHYVRPFPPLSE
ncbi:hypothetical protein DV735_g2527, partial [Chaetothyriales sp. CBS 134920]